MLKRRAVTLMCCMAGLVGWPVSVRGQDRPSVAIAVAAGSPDEIAGREQLLRILGTWDLSPWLFTREARIESRAIPRSHPTLTVNTRYLENDTAQVATFIHEQLHWFLSRHRAATDSAVSALEAHFPDAPDGPPDGARDRYSTYLHLLVCVLEYDGVAKLFDEDVARRTLAAWRHYRWVYSQVLERPEPIRQVLARYGLGEPDARSFR